MRVYCPRIYNTRSGSRKEAKTIRTFAHAFLNENAKARAYRFRREYKAQVDSVRNREHEASPKWDTRSMACLCWIHLGRFAECLVDADGKEHVKDA